MKSPIVPVFLAAVLLAFLVSAVTAQQQSAPPGVYTQPQADAGRVAYDVSCGGCHGADLTGSSDAPALTGVNFSNAWGPRPLSDLFADVMETMPPASPGGLGEEVTLGVVAYLLQRMGASPGVQALTRERTTSLSAALASSGGAGILAIGAGTGSGQGRGGVTAVRGVTIRGEVRMPPSL